MIWNCLPGYTFSPKLPAKKQDTFTSFSFRARKGCQFVFASLWSCPVHSPMVPSSLRCFSWVALFSSLPYYKICSVNPFYYDSENWLLVISFLVCWGVNCIACDLVICKILPSMWLRFHNKCLDPYLLTLISSTLSYEMAVYLDSWYPVSSSDSSLLWVLFS